MYKVYKGKIVLDSCTNKKKPSGILYFGNTKVNIKDNTFEIDFKFSNDVSPKELINKIKKNSLLMDWFKEMLEQFELDL